MVGTPRSGGRNSKAPLGTGDGLPESPRQLDGRARELFDWLLDRLDCDATGSPWSRIDGCLLADCAELLAHTEALELLLRKSPDDARLLRLRIQYADRIARLSGLLGLTPFDRRRQVATEPAAGDGDVFGELMARMARG